MPPSYNLTQKQETILYLLWQIDNITDLHYALGETDVSRTGVKWRVRGTQSSLEDYESSPSPQPGTVEIRIMQGTLDADHINNWVVVLERIMHATRNLSNADFQGLLSQFVINPTQELLLFLLGVPADIQEYWADAKRRNQSNTWWEYPDQDRVDWDQPFMVRGHKATHGDYWD